MFRRSRALGLVLCLSLLLSSVPLWGASSSVKLVVEPGITELSLWEETVIINATAEVYVLLKLVDGEITGTVAPVPDSDGTVYVEIIVVGPPDKIVFDGPVDGPTPFESVQPHETGHSEG